MSNVFIIGNTKPKDAADIFARAKQELESKGYKAVNMFDYVSKGEEFKTEKHLAGLMPCTHVFLLSNWGEDELSILELHVAIVARMEILKANDTILPGRFSIYTK